jgi:hypothetical protein
MAEEVTSCQEKSRIPCIWYMARAFTGFLQRGATDNSLNVIKPMISGVWGCPYSRELHHLVGDHQIATRQRATP